MRPTYHALDLLDAPPVRLAPDLTDASADDPLLDAPGWPRAMLRDAALRRLAPPIDDGHTPVVPARLRAAQVVPRGPVPPTEPIDLRSLRGGGQTLIAPEPVDEIVPDGATDAWFADDTVEAAPERTVGPIRPPWWALAIPLAGAMVGSGIALATLVAVLLV